MRYLKVCRKYLEKIGFDATFSNKFSIFLISGCQTASQKLKCLQTAISISCETIEQFQKIEKSNDNSDHSKRNADILKQFELNLQQILKHLIQVSINKQSDANSIAEYKRLYSSSLQSSAQKDDFVKFASHLKTLLQTIQQAVLLSC